MTKAIDIEKTKEGYLEFVEEHKNIVLNMVNEEGRPFASCAPFVKKNGKFYVYISQIAEHYRHLENSEWIDAMIIADESGTPNPFATERARCLDFSLFELTPTQGRYVVGFGLAFDVDIDGDVFEHVVVDKKNKAGVTA